MPALSVSFMRRPRIGRDAFSGWLASARTCSVVIRLFAAVWFLLLGAASVHSISGQIAKVGAGETSFGAAWPALLSQGCIFVFYTIIFCIMVLLPEPVSRATGVRQQC